MGCFYATDLRIPYHAMGKNATPITHPLAPEPHPAGCSRIYPHTKPVIIAMHTKINLFLFFFCNHWNIINKKKDKK